MKKDTYYAIKQITSGLLIVYAICFSLEKIKAKQLQERDLCSLKPTLEKQL